MKVERAKKNRKIVRYFQINFDFRPPYKLLLDSSFILHAFHAKVDLKDSVIKIFQEQIIYLFTTDCVIECLKNEPSTSPELIEFASKFDRMKCRHPDYSDQKDLSPSDVQRKCLIKLMRSQMSVESSPSYFVAAIQGESTKEPFQKSFPQCPFLSVFKQVVVLEKPSQFTMASVQQRQRDVRSISKEEKASMSNMVPTKEHPNRSHSGKRKKRPNPLSLQRSKKSKSQTNGQKRKRHRKRNKSDSLTI